MRIVPCTAHHKGGARFKRLQSRFKSLPVYNSFAGIGGFVEHELRDLAGRGNVARDKAEGAGIGIGVGAQSVGAVDAAGDLTRRVQAGMIWP